MRLHEQPEAVDKQIVLPDTQPRGETAFAIQVQEPQATITEIQAVADLIAVAEKENEQSHWFAVLGFWMGLQITLVAAIPHSPVATILHGFSTALAVYFGRRYTTRFRATTAALAAESDLRMIGPLIDRLRPGSTDRRVRRVLKQALVRLLPRLKASDASLLAARQKAELAHYLGGLAMSPQHAELQVVILRALEQVGDAQAIPVVERIIQRKPRWSAQALVHRAAVDCLPFLLARADADKTRNTLLRSASGFGGGSGE